MFRNKVKKNVSEREMYDLLEIKQYDKTLAAFKTKNDTYMDIMQINCKDLKNIGEDSVINDIYTWIKVHRTHTEDLKIVGMNFPMNTTHQQQLFIHLLNKNNNYVYERFLNESLSQLQIIQEQNTEREFFLFVYGNNKQELREIREKYYHVLNSRDLIHYITQQKKELILFKMNNKNSIIKIEDETV